MWELLTSTEAWAAFLTLLIMEIILGVDNIVFISIQTDKLPPEQQKMGRNLGLLFALFTRVVLLLSITWVMTLTAPGCGMGPILVDDVQRKVSEVPNVTDVHVDLTFDPPWNPEMMSEAARLQTGMY